MANEGERRDPDENSQLGSTGITAVVDRRGRTRLDSGASLEEFPPESNVVLRNVRRVTDPVEYGGYRLEADISVLRADQLHRSGVGHRRDDSPGVLFVWRANQQCSCQQCNESRRLLVPELDHPRQARYIRAVIV